MNGPLDGPIDDIIVDGKCIIELYASESGIAGTWTQRQLKRAAFRLLDKCMLNGDHEGGSARSIGSFCGC